jgi:hypothetical protein
MGSGKGGGCRTGRAKNEGRWTKEDKHSIKKLKAESRWIGKDRIAMTLTTDSLNR